MGLRAGGATHRYSVALILSFDAIVLQYLSTVVFGTAARFTAPYQKATANSGEISLITTRNGIDLFLEN
jgi:hypothetical protein